MEFIAAPGRVGLLLPCQSGKYLYIKIFDNMHRNRIPRENRFVAWIGGIHGFGNEAVAHQCQTPCENPLKGSTATNRLLQSTRITRDQEEDSVDHDTDNGESNDTDHHSIMESYRPRRSIRDQSRIDYVSPDTTATPVKNRPTVKEGHSLTRNPNVALTSNKSTFRNIKSLDSPSSDAIPDPSSECMIVDSPDIVFNFIVSLPEVEELLPGSKPDSIPLGLSECKNSDCFFTYARMAWEMGSDSTGSLKGVRCGREGAQRKSIIPWGNGEIYKNVIKILRSAKTMEPGGKLNVDVYCIGS